LDTRVQLDEGRRLMACSLTRCASHAQRPITA
jgi:hypothetical protein